MFKWRRNYTAYIQEILLTIKNPQYFAFTKLKLIIIIKKNLRERGAFQMKFQAYIMKASFRKLTFHNAFQIRLKSLKYMDI